MGSPKLSTARHAASPPSLRDLPVHSWLTPHMPALALMVSSVHRCPGGCGELPEQTDPGTCGREPVHDQPAAPAASEILQFGSLPSKVRGAPAALLPRSMFRTGLVCVSVGKIRTLIVTQCFESQLSSVQTLSQIHLKLIETRAFEF